MTLGRPTLYKPEYCELLVEHMSKGLSFESFAGVIDTCRSILYDWVRDHSEFSDAKKRGVDKSLLIWELKGLDGLYDKSFQIAGWIFNMKARFRWSEPVVIKNEKEEEMEKIKKMPMSELVKLIRDNLPED